MKKYKVSTEIILDTRRAITKGTNKGTYPVKIRLNYKDKRQYYNVGIFMTEEDFASAKEGKNEAFKDDHEKIGDVEKEARKVIKDLPVFTFEGFKKKFFDDTDYADFFSVLKERIKKMEKEGRPGMASSLQSTLKWWKEFHKSETLPFESINVKKLTDFENYLLKKEKSEGTVGIYQRNVRTIFNEAIKAGSVKREFYPFGSEDDDLYEIPEARNFKRALLKSDVGKIRKYKALSGSPEEYYRDLWVFSYLCNGANLADIARLKYENIARNSDGSGTIVFRRKKTKRHKRKPMPIIVELSAEIDAILDRWGNTPHLADTYVFNILKRGCSPSEELATVKQETKQMNSTIGRIATKVGIPGKVTSYSARHTFASVLKLSGESDSFISESMGHQNVNTTKAYLSSFDSAHRKRAQKKLL